MVGNVNAVTVAEHTLFLILALAKQCIPYDRAVREGHWTIRDSFAAIELAGKTLLIVGFGRIGREVARRAAAFDLQVAAYDPYVGCRRDGRGRRAEGRGLAGGPGRGGCRDPACAAHA